MSGRRQWGEVHCLRSGGLPGAKFAVRDRRLSYNPAEGVKLPRATRPEPVFLSHQQVDRLAEACIEYELFIRLLAYTGLRWAEATALQVKRLDLMRRRLEVVRTAIDLGQEITYGTPKRASVGAHPRSLVEQLAEHVAGKGPDDLVFTSPRGAAFATTTSGVGCSRRPLSSSGCRG